MAERPRLRARDSLCPVPCPTQRNPRWYPLLLVRNTTARTRCVFLSEEITGFPLHFSVNAAGGGFSLCERSKCPLCLAGWPAPWYGFAAVLASYDGPLRLLSLPQAAYQWCDGLHAAQGRLRGRVLTLQRPRGNATGPVVATLGDQVQDLERLPRPFDVVEQVALRFGTQAARVRQLLAGGAQ
jgi:hypothetical protein